MRTPRFAACFKRNSRASASRSTCHRSLTGAREIIYEHSGHTCCASSAIILACGSSPLHGKSRPWIQRRRSGEEVNHFAKEAGIFKKHGLDVEIVYIPGGSTVVQAMLSGGVQFGRGSATEVVSSHLAGYPLKILAALINKFVYSFVTSLEISKPQDLKGKAVAVSRFGSGSDFITRMALK